MIDFVVIDVLHWCIFLLFLLLVMLGHIEVTFVLFSYREFVDAMKEEAILHLALKVLMMRYSIS